MGTDRWQPLGPQFKKICGGKLVEVLTIVPEEGEGAMDGS